MEKRQYINSRLFYHLLQLGGQSLVGTYAMLLKGRDNYHCYTPIKNSNGKLTKGKRLISKQSGVSLTALEKNLPILINLGLCHHMKGGGFHLAGQQKIKHKYNSYKNIPIRIGKNLRETKGNVNAIMIIANGYKQTKQIDKKITLTKALRQEAKGLPLSHKQTKLILNAHKSKNVNLDNLNKVENIVLSNANISNLITGCERGENKNSISHGGYWRKVLEERGFIHSRRRYKSVWNEQMSYNEFLSRKKWFTEQFGFVTYKNGRIVKPIVSEVMFPNLDIIDNNIYNTNIIVNIYNIKNGVEVEDTLLDVVNQNENRL